jgi:hypothetical protein
MNIDIVRLPKDLDSAIAGAKDLAQSRERTNSMESAMPQHFASQKRLKEHAENPQSLQDATPNQRSPAAIQDSSPGQAGPPQPTVDEDSEADPRPRRQRGKSPGRRSDSGGGEQYNNPQTPRGVHLVSIAITTMILTESKSDSCRRRQEPVLVTRKPRASMTSFVWRLEIASDRWKTSCRKLRGMRHHHEHQRISKSTQSTLSLKHSAGTTYLGSTIRLIQNI